MIRLQMKHKERMNAPDRVDVECKFVVVDDNKNVYYRVNYHAISFTDGGKNEFVDVLPTNSRKLGVQMPSIERDFYGEFRVVGRPIFTSVDQTIPKEIIMQIAEETRELLSQFGKDVM